MNPFANRPSRVGVFCLAIAALCIAGVANAADAWNEDTVTWSPPAACADGSATTNCPVTGYKVETAPSKTSSTWVTVATVGNVLTAKATGLTAGVHCYRVSTIAANGTSAAAVQGNDCPVTTAPLPGPPTNVLTTVEQTVYDVRPNEQTFAFDLGRRVGTVKLGAACDESRSTGNGFYALERPSRVSLTRAARSTALVARCG